MSWLKASLKEKADTGLKYPPICFAPELKMFVHHLCFCEDTDNKFKNLSLPAFVRVKTIPLV